MRNVPALSVLAVCRKAVGQMQCHRHAACIPCDRPLDGASGQVTKNSALEDKHKAGIIACRETKAGHVIAGQAVNPCLVWPCDGGRVIALGDGKSAPCAGGSFFSVALRAMLVGQDRTTSCPASGCPILSTTS